MEKVHFMHIRNVDRNDQISNFGGVTYAYQEVLGGVMYAKAECSVRENFVKALGRAKAKGRLNSPRYSRVFMGTFDEFRQEIFKMAQ